MVAEGVENDAAMAMLRSFGCDIGQGYGICRPLPLARLTDWLGTATVSALAGRRPGG